MKHQWKFDNNEKYVVCPNLLFSKSFKDNTKGNYLYLKTRSKHYLHKEIIKLIKKNHLLTTKLNVMKTIPGKIYVFTIMS
jgi:hypothetical protein